LVDGRGAGAALRVCCLLWEALFELLLLLFFAANTGWIITDKAKTSAMNAIFFRNRLFRLFCWFFLVNIIILLC
jgi:hypothetical protein